jgi:transposase
MTQRLEFIQAVLHRAPGVSIREVCRTTGMSEKTGHKWLQRFGAGGPAALTDRSHAPHEAPHQVPRAVAAMLCALREAQPTWGARANCATFSSASSPRCVGRRRVRSPRSSIASG